MFRHMLEYDHEEAQRRDPMIYVKYAVTPLSHGQDAADCYPG